MCGGTHTQTDRQTHTHTMTWQYLRAGQSEFFLKDYAMKEDVRGVNVEPVYYFQPKNPYKITNEEVSQKISKIN